MTRVLSFIAIYLLIACQQPGDGPIFKDVLPDSNGGRLDLMVIAKDAYWEDTPGEVLRKYITTPQAGLPQPEPLFTVRQVEPKSFSQLLKRARNLIILKIGEPAFSIKENKYAKPQILITIAAPDKNGLAETIAENHEKITRYHQTR
ncbi:MAG: DUF4837 family protein [Owenweeksia sp.]|nr:DUF4837 family protein [Owenweeksia sp.]